MSAPLVSVIMANYGGARHLPRALSSVLAQTLAHIEVIVSDDASPDDSIAVVQGFMQRDDRVRLISAPSNGGPARARNRALDAARGEWIAIVDSDDILHPERLERLLVAAARHGADAVADDLLHFHDNGAPTMCLLHGDAFTIPFRLTPELFIRCNMDGTDLPKLGYIKPMIRSEALRGLRYDETLRIGEDYDLLLRLLLDGLKFQIVPDPTYLYRRHEQSISHRLSQGAVQAMIANQRDLESQRGPFAPEVEQALACRMAALRRSLRFEQLVSAIKSRNWRVTAGLVMRDLGLLALLWRSFRERLGRQRTRAAGRSRSADLGARTPDLVLSSRPGSLELKEALSAHFKALGREDIRMEAVPPYSPPGDGHWGDEMERRLWCRLATIGSTEKISVICDGLAGAFAAGFLPAGEVTAVLVEHVHEGKAAQSLLSAYELDMPDWLAPPSDEQPPGAEILVKRSPRARQARFSQ
jgi:succinoglycan biosynthesis protein ExoO